MERRVAITGIGMLNAAGAGIDAIWERLRSDPPRPVEFAGAPPTEGIRFPVYRAVDYRLAELPVPARCRRWLAEEGLEHLVDLRHLIGATALALDDAGLAPHHGGEEPPVAVVVADESPGFDALSQALFELGLEAPVPAEPAARYAHLAGHFFQLNSFLLPHYLARAFGFEGLSLFVNSACTSGLNALEIAAQEIRSGRSLVALAAAADDPLSAAKFLWFHSLGLYSTAGTLRPFDAEPAGTVFGDGGAALVLEDLESARRRGARIYGELLGCGFAQDGWKITVPQPTRALAAKAIERALAAGRVEAAAVDLVVPHGVGTAASDGYEALVLHQIFAPLPRWPAVTAFKPMIGHNLGGAALMEIGLLLAAMWHGSIPPTLGHRLPPKRHPLPLVTRWTERSVELAVKLTCGFAGYFGAAVFRRHGGGAGQGAESP